ncbi:hypothetical protein [Streptomyces sp. NPDC058632]
MDWWIWMVIILVVIASVGGLALRAHRRGGTGIGIDGRRPGHGRRNRPV